MAREGNNIETKEKRMGDREEGRKKVGSEKRRREC